jgi:hypothetical protein
MLAQDSNGGLRKASKLGGPTKQEEVTAGGQELLKWDVENKKRTVYVG